MPGVINPFAALPSVARGFIPAWAAKRPQKTNRKLPGTPRWMDQGLLRTPAGASSLATKAER